jgi:hypothetical protein
LLSHGLKEIPHREVMFYMKHGEDQQAMFNARCQSVVLMNYIRASLNLPPGGYDLMPIAADYKGVAPLAVADRGEVSASTFINLRGAYALLQFKEDEEGTRQYTSLWKPKNPEERERIELALDAKAADDKKKGTAPAKGSVKKK